MSSVVHCLRCHRILKQRDSIRRGYGSVCFSKIGGHPDGQLEIPKVNKTLLEIYGNSTSQLRLSQIPEFVPIVKSLSRGRRPRKIKK